MELTKRGKSRKGIDLGKDPVGLLVLKMSIPSMVAMLAMSFYNVVDAFWIARLSSHAIAALTICFPIQIILGAIGVGTGMGAGSFASRMLGSGDDTKANRTAGQVVFLSVFFGILTILTGLALYDPLLIFFGATEEILPLSRQYLIITLFGTPFLFLMMMSDNLFRAEGNPNIPMYIIITSAAINVVLDPFLIFGWGPFPEMGIQGAALATTISQVVTSFMSLYFLLFSQSKYRLKWAYLIPDLSIMNSIYKVGVPSSVVSIAMSLVLTVYNNKLAGFGHLALAALGLGFRINGVLVMIFFGIGHGVMPTVGFNYGASNYERLEEVVKSAVRLSAMIGAVSCLLTEIFARPILMAFTNDPELLSIAVPALRIYVATQVLVGPMIVWINMFNGAGKGLTSMVLLLSRQIIFLIPLIYILPVHFGLNGVWMAQPVADLLTFFIVLFWTRKESKTFKRQMTLQLPDVGQI